MYTYIYIYPFVLVDLLQNLAVFLELFQATPPRIDLNVLNILAEVLIELRDFEKRACTMSTVNGVAWGTNGPENG